MVPPEPSAPLQYLNIRNCKVHADKPWVVGSGRINGSGYGGVGIVHQVLVLAHKSRTPISEARSGVGVKRGCLNKAGMD